MQHRHYVILRDQGGDAPVEKMSSRTATGQAMQHSLLVSRVGAFAAVNGFQHRVHDQNVARDAVPQLILCPGLDGLAFGQSQLLVEGML